LSNVAAGEANGASTQAPISSKVVATNLYRVVWRWHFIAGILLGPLICIVAVTGALYIFKYELEPLWHADVVLVTPQEELKSLDVVVSAAKQEVPSDWQIDQVEIPADPGRSIAIVMHGLAGQRRVFVDQYSGQVLGEISPTSFFPLVLKLHRNLFVGTAGRVLVELATCWSLVLLFTGLYLWWPRKSKANRSVWLPRLRGPTYRVVRDLHAVLGFWALPVAAVIAFTGLVYAYAWGYGFLAASFLTGAYDTMLKPPKIEQRVSDQPSWELVYAAARTHAPGMAYTMLPAEDVDKPYTVMAGNLTGPSMTRLLLVDSTSGEVLLDGEFADFPFMAKWSSWNYPLHTGSVLGLPTKIIWLLVSIIFAMMPVTGFWMWLSRRPQGKSGWPKVIPGKLPLWLKLTTVAVCCFLPLAGISLLLVYLLDVRIGSGRQQAIVSA